MPSISSIPAIASGGIDSESRMQSIVLANAPVARGACAVPGQGTVWVLNKGANTVSIRRARTGEVVSKIDLLDEGAAIASVGNRVWISTAANKTFVFDHEGTLLGALQTASNPIRRFFSLNEQLLFTTSNGKDFVKWDTSQFTVEHTYFGRLSGEVITDIVLGCPKMQTVLVSSTKSLRLWGLDGTCFAELGEGATALCLVHHADDRDYLWAAQGNWITVFSIASLSSVTQFLREKTLPCPNVVQLIRTAPQHIASIDAEAVVTLWSDRTMTTLRSFKVAPLTSNTTNVSAPSVDYTLQATQTTTNVLWTLHDARALVWTDEYSAHEADATASSDTAKDLQGDEIRFLQRKIQFLESIGTMYRQKAGVLFRELGHSEIAAGGPRSAASQRIAQFNEIDAEYARSLEVWKRSDFNQEPIPEAAASDLAVATASGNAGANGDFTEYWKTKYKEAVSELERAKADNEGLMSMLHGTASEGDLLAAAAGSSHSLTSHPSGKELDVKRAHHICQIIKEKNELKEHIRQLTDDVSKLRMKLREYNSPLASRGPNEEDAQTLRQLNEELRAEVTRLRAKSEAEAAVLAENQSAMKHNQILKQRVKKLRSDLDQAQVQLSEQTANSQQEMQSLLDTIAGLQMQVEAEKGRAAEAKEAEATAQLMLTQKQAVMDRFQAIAEAAERELSHREAVERAAQSQVRTEVEMLCQSLDDRDRRLTDLLAKLDETATLLRTRSLEAAEAKALAQAREEELAVQAQRISQLEEVVRDRKTYGRVMGELQGRLEMLVEELRRTFTPVQFADNINNLENRVGALFALESQLKQKDDVIAMKEDELLRVKEYLARLQDQVAKVSSVFLHLPKSVEEVELLMVEVDEYRRRLGLDPETQEMIQIRLLEVQAKRKAGVKVMDDLLPKASSKSAQELLRLKELSATLQSVANAAAAEDKQGLVTTPAPRIAATPAATPATD